MPPGRRRLYPFEIAALGTTVGFALLLTAMGHPIEAPSLRRTLALAMTLLVGGGALGVTLQCGWHAATRRGVGRYWRSVREPAWLWLWLRLWLACILASNAYFWLKVYVPRLNAAGFDPALWRLDRALHLGVSPTALLQTWLPPGAVTSALDVWYGLWLLTLFASIAFFCASDRPALRRGVMLSCIVLWSSGALCYAVLPAMGPVFAFPGFFSSLPAAMPIAAATQDQLLANYRGVVESGSVADYTRGVAALPSLHVGFHFLFALWARHAARGLFPLLLVLTLLTFVGSVRTGWHYAVDGYVGVALAALAFAASRRLEAR